MGAVYIEQVMSPLGKGKMPEYNFPNSIYIILPASAHMRHPPMSVIRPLSGVKRTSASDCQTIAIYEYTP
jgi:hypothetical protein